MEEKLAGGYMNRKLAELYDQVPLYTSREDVALFVEEARRSGGPVLELGCGTGRVLLRVARAGMEIVGLDLAEPMLERLRKKLEGEPAEVRARVKVVHGNMSAFDLGRRFSLITIPFRPIQHIVGVKDQIACLECVNRHLEIGGRFIFDVFNPNLEMLIQEAPTKEQLDFEAVEIEGGRTVKRTHRVLAYRLSEQVNDVELIYEVTYPDGSSERVVQSFPFRYFFRYEVEHLLARCGFRIVELYGDYQRSPFKEGSKEMVFIAAKEREV